MGHHLPQRAAFDLVKELLRLKAFKVYPLILQVTKQPCHLPRAALPLPVVMSSSRLTPGVLLCS